jgi:hypothetical protein
MEPFWKTSFFQRTFALTLRSPTIHVQNGKEKTMRKTKIVFTLGRDRKLEKVLRDQIDGGMGMAGLNSSHGIHESHGPAHL